MAKKDVVEAAVNAAAFSLEIEGEVLNADEKKLIAKRLKGEISEADFFKEIQGRA